MSIQALTGQHLVDGTIRQLVGILVTIVAGMPFHPCLLYTSDAADDTQLGEFTVVGGWG